MVKFIIFYLPIIAVIVAIKLWYDWALHLKDKERNAKFFVRTWAITGAIVFALSFGINTLESAYSNYHGYEKGDCLEYDYDERGRFCIQWEPVYVGIDKEFQNYLINGLKYGVVIGLLGAFVINGLDEQNGQNRSF